LAAIANGGPTPRQPKGPGSSHWARELEADDLGRAADDVTAVAHHDRVGGDVAGDLGGPPVVRDRDVVGHALRVQALARLVLAGADAVAPAGDAGVEAARQRLRELREHLAHVASDADREGTVAAELGRVAVHHAHASVLGEGGRAAVAEAEVERSAEHEHDVGLAEREAASLGEGQRMRGRQTAAAGAVHEDRRAGGLGERRERAHGVVPVHAGAGHHHRAFGAAQQLGHALDGHRVAGGRRAMHVAGGDRGEAILDRGEEQVDRDLDEDRARSPRERDADRGREHLGDLARLDDRPRALGDRPQQGDLLHLLQGTEAAQAQRGGAPDEQQRAAGGVRVGHAGHGVGHAGSGGDDRHPDVAGEPRVGVGRVGRRLLVAYVDHGDAVLHAAVIDRQDVTAAQREDVADAGLLQHPRDELAAGEVGHQPAARPSPAGGIGAGVTRIFPT